MSGLTFRLAIFVCALLGILTGLGSLALVAARGIAFDAIESHGWRFTPRVGSPDIDPYRRARLFASGELPLAVGEGFSLLSLADHHGEALNSRCNYRLESPFPPARYWTLTIMHRDGRLISHPTGRTGFTSAEIIRGQDGRFSIEVSAEPKSGNWLPMPENSDISLQLRLYEPPLAATATRLDPASLPFIRRMECAP